MNAFLKGSLALMASVLVLSSCAEKAAYTESLSGLKTEDFQTQWLGQEIGLYTLRGSSGMEVQITNFGGRIVSIMVPDKDGIMRDVIVGFDNIRDYTTISSDFGASVGRYANRIKDARISIDGQEYQLVANNFGHCLHGGCTLEEGNVIGWQYMPYEVVSATEKSIRLKLISKDGEAGFPGNVVAYTTYTLTEDNALDIQWEAMTDKKTYVNQTNHAYFNLNGNPDEPITNHLLEINASYYTPVDSTFMTTGEILEVKGTPMDFTSPKEVGEDIENFSFTQIKNGNGFDHNWVLDTKGDDQKVAARLKSPVTGIVLEVLTNEPGIQFYSGNFLDGSFKGKAGKTIRQHAAMCLETQKFPDTPNKSNLEGWPDALLSPGELYKSHCVYRFKTENN